MKSPPLQPETLNQWIPGCSVRRFAACSLKSRQPQTPLDTALRITEIAPLPGDEPLDTAALPSLQNALGMAGVASLLSACGGGGSSPPAVSPPSSPTGLTVTPGNAVVNLSWGSVSAANNYEVKRSTNNRGPYVVIGSPSATSATDSSVVNGTTYYYVVSAVNAGGASADSADRKRVV